MRQVRDVEHQLPQLSLQRFELRFARLQFVGRARNFSHQRRCILALALGDADLLRCAVAFCLQFLRAHLHRLALLFQPAERLDVELVAARGERGLNAFQVGSK